MARAAQNQLTPAVPPAQQEWLYNFLAQGCCGILERWIDGGMAESIEETSGFADRLIENATRQL